MRLLIIRHAIAEAPGTRPDSQRALTREGREKMHKAALGLSALESAPELLLTSPYLRARQTAELVAEAFGLPLERIVETQHLAPGGSPRALVHALATEHAAASRVALVGHDPGVGELASLLLTGDTEACLTVKKGGACALEAERLRLGPCASLEWLMTPSQLAAQR